MRERFGMALLSVASLALSACGGAGTPERALPTAQGEAAIPGWVTPSMGKPGVGDAAPDFDLADGAGNRVKLSSLRGSVVVMQFGASFCPFSKAELPHLNQLAKDYAGKNVKVLLVDVDEGDPEYKEYSSRMPLTLTMLRDEGGNVAKTYAPEHAQLAIKRRQYVMIPSNLIVDPDGEIAFYTLLDSDHFDAELVALRKKLDGVLAGGKP
jgi:peroxiredoxin